MEITGHSISAQASRVEARPALWLAAALLMLSLGLGVRLLDLTDPPLDFHPTRQLRAAIIARGMYYERLPDADPHLREEALRAWSSMEVYEPPLLERMVASTYRLLGSERLWVARVYSSLFWVIGGAALFGFLRRMFSPGAALFGLGFYLFLPWGVVASRSFQPDPWMVMWVLLAAYALLRWLETQACSWRWAALAGAFSGMAILVKVYAFYPIAAMALGTLVVLLSRAGSLLKNLVALVKRPQAWLFLALLVIIPALYYLRLGGRSSEFASFWIFSLSGLLADRKFYIHWLGLVRGLVDVMIFFAALLGAFLFPARGRALALGLWAGYFLIGLTFPFQIYTHDYYSILLVPIVAISLAPIFDLILNRLKVEPLFWKAVFTAVFLAIAGYYIYVARSQLYASDYRSEPVPWQRMGQELPSDGDMIALTHDYGNRLKYYGWRMVNRLWPGEGDLDLAAAAGGDRIGDFESFFQSQTEGMDYFLVTLFGDLEGQPALKAELYDHYPVYSEGDGYIVFDLRERR